MSARQAAVAADRSRYLHVPAAELIARLNAIGDAASTQGATSRWTTRGSERVWILTLRNGGEIHLYTATGDAGTRGCGEDAIRLLAGAPHGGGGFRPWIKVKILRTAPRRLASDAARREYFLARLQSAIREAYRSVRASPKCPDCGALMAPRRPKTRDGQIGGAPFWGCTNFPECKRTLPRRA